MFCGVVDVSFQVCVCTRCLVLVFMVSVSTTTTHSRYQLRECAPVTFCMRNLWPMRRSCKFLRWSTTSGELELRGWMVEEKE